VLVLFEIEYPIAIPNNSPTARAPTIKTAAVVLLTAVMVLLNRPSQAGNL
jgi:hypothetical protein